MQLNSALICLFINLSDNVRAGHKRGLPLPVQRKQSYGYRDALAAPVWRALWETLYGTPQIMCQSSVLRPVLRQVTCSGSGGVWASIVPHETVCSGKERGKHLRQVKNEHVLTLGLGIATHFPMWSNIDELSAYQEQYSTFLHRNISLNSLNSCCELTPVGTSL